MVGNHGAASHSSDVFSSCLPGDSGISLMNGERAKIWIMAPRGARSRVGSRYTHTCCSGVDARQSPPHRGWVVARRWASEHPGRFEGLRETTQELDLEGILRLSDLEDENTGCPVKSEFLTCNESFSVVRLCPIYCIGREGWSRGVFRWLREGGALQSVGTGLRKGAEV